MSRSKQVRFPELSRREVLKAGGALIGSLALPRGPVLAADSLVLPEAVTQALSKSKLVYVSPLHPDGRESRCHGEVWFFVDGQDVVIGTAHDRWKAAAVARGWNRARIWVGDFGPAKDAGDKLDTAPNFWVRALVDRDAATFERLFDAFGQKYSDSWQKWGPRFRASYDDGSRLLIRYSPIPEPLPPAAD